MTTIRTIFFIFLFYMLFVIALNFIIAFMAYFHVNPAYYYYKNGFTIDIPLLKRVYIFAHGEYKQVYSLKGEQKEVFHILHQNGKVVRTQDLITKYIYEKNYKYMWLSACDTGNHDYTYKNFKTGVELKWEDKYVNRNKHPGISLIFFNGFGVTRVPYEW